MCLALAATHDALTTLCCKVAAADILVPCANAQLNALCVYCTCNAACDGTSPAWLCSSADSSISHVYVQAVAAQLQMPQPQKAFSDASRAACHRPSAPPFTTSAQTCPQQTPAAAVQGQWDGAGQPLPNATSELQPHLPVLQQPSNNHASRQDPITSQGTGVNAAHAWQPLGANLQPGPAHLQFGTATPQLGNPNLQPGPAHLQFGTATPQLGNPNLQPGTADMQPGPANLQPGNPNLQPGPANLQPDPANLQPDPAKLQPGTASLQQLSSEAHRIGSSSSQQSVQHAAPRLQGGSEAGRAGQSSSRWGAVNAYRQAREAAMRATAGAPPPPPLCFVSVASANESLCL